MENKAFLSLKNTMNQYSLLEEDTWQSIQSFCKVRSVVKGENLVSMGETPKSFFYIYQGLFRAYTLLGDASKEVNKGFFQEGRFPATILALLQARESEFFLEALEDSIVVEIHFARFRELLREKKDLMLYHINYLEKHWVIEKEPVEVSLLGEDSKARYINFAQKYPELLERIPLYHIASHLGITPTQLSRIRSEVSRHM